MATSLDQFIKHLSDCGILSADDLQAFRDDLPRDRSPREAQGLADELIRRKKLTPFQAEAILRGETSGLVLGSYVILGELGEGGMGCVYKAMHRRMDRVVALKVLPATLTSEASAVLRFEREIKAISRVLHPNIVTAFDANEAKGVHFLVMEYIEGTDLYALVWKEGPLPVAHAIGAIRQAARGLGYAHRKGIVHRDVKPANLIQDAEGTVKVLDLGLARLRPSMGSYQEPTTQAKLTGVNSMMGTVDFMAPEQALDARHADHRADIYSLGCTLYYLLTARAAYCGDTVTKKILAHREHPIPSLCRVRDDVSVDLDTLAGWMMAKRPEDRPQSMEEVLTALEPMATAPDLGKAAAVVEMPPARLLEYGDTLILEEGPPGRSEVSTLEDIRTDSSLTPLTVPSAKPRGSGPPGIPARNTGLALGGLAAVIILFAAVIFKVKTPDGTLEVEVSEPGAQVQVLDEQDGVQVTSRNTEGPIRIAVDPGRHRLKVEKEGFRFFTKDFTIEAGGRATITAKLVPLEGKTTVVRPRPPSDRPEDPAFDRWLKGVAEMPAEVQVEAVSARLKDLNPGFDGKVMHHEEGGVVTFLQFVTNAVLDISPVRALTGLRELDCSATPGKGRLSDLSPLKGLRLTALHCNYTAVADLSPLADMKLTTFACMVTKVNDLSPLAGMPLEALGCSGSKVTDLSPLKGMNLKLLNCDHTTIADLSPLTGMPLMTLNCGGTKVADLSALTGMTLSKLEIFETEVAKLAPLTGMKLTTLYIQDTPVADLSPLIGMPLKDLNCSGTKVTDLSPLEGMKLTQMLCVGTKVDDLSPLAGMPLEVLLCSGSKISVLSPLKGMKLTLLGCDMTKVTDLSPLTGMPLMTLNCEGTKVFDLSPLAKTTVSELALSGTDVVDLSPLKGMKLTKLHFRDTSVADLSPLIGMPLKDLDCWGTKVTDLSPVKEMPLKSLLCNFKAERDSLLLRSLKTLETINLKPAAEFWKEVDEGPRREKP